MSTQTVVEYLVQIKDTGLGWHHFDDMGYLTLESAKNGIEYARETHPEDEFRVVKQTITQEVIEE